MDVFIVKAKADGGIDFKSNHQNLLFKKRLKQLSQTGKEFALMIDEKKPTRSEAQNRFYWLYVGMISDETGYTKDELHALFGGKFLTREIKEVMGLRTRVTKSTTELTKSEFSEYIIEIQNFTKITPPDTQEFFFGTH